MSRYSPEEIERALAENETTMPIKLRSYFEAASKGNLCQYYKETFAELKLMFESSMPGTDACLELCLELNGVIADRVLPDENEEVKSAITNLLNSDWSLPVSQFPFREKITQINLVLDKVLGSIF